jgi:acetyl-CoA synthetase
MAVKVGRSEQAQAASMAHSGSLAGETRVTEAALAAVGVIRCADLDELLEAAELVEGCRRTSRGVGRGRTAVVTVSTGEASLIADLVPRTGVDLPPIPPPARAAILAALPTMTHIDNPMDPWGADDPPTAYGAVFEALAASDAYDVLVLVHDFPYRSLPSEVQTAEEVTRPLLAATRHRPSILPVYVSLTSGEPPPETKALLNDVGRGAPILRGAVEAFAAIAGLAQWERRRQERSTAGPRRAAWTTLAADRTSWAFQPAGPSAPLPPEPGGRLLPEAESLELLARAGLPAIAFARAADPAAAAQSASRLGFPVAVKLDARGLAHKTEVGGVRLGLGDATAVIEASTDLLSIRLTPPAEMRGLLVQPMAPPGVELIVGLRRDPQFGPAVVVGFGGVLAEAFDDVAVRLAPIPIAEATRMLDELRGARLLHGYRGRPGVDLAAVAELVVAVGELGIGDPGIAEIDLNPVVASSASVTVVDALVLFY